MKDVFTKDNLFHSLVAIGFVLLASLLFGSFWAFPAAVVAGIGLYVRELIQADFDASFSTHKHLEWGVGAAAGFLAAVVVVLL